MSRAEQLLLKVTGVSDASEIGCGFVLSWNTAEAVELGRHPECGLHLADSTVSRRHVRLFSDGDQNFVESLTASNGTFLDGEALGVGEAGALSVGTVLQVGGVLLQVQGLQETVPVVEPIAAGATAVDASLPGLAFRVVWDADKCVIALSGRHLDLPPTAARTLGLLLENAPDIVHQWDLVEHLGTGVNLPQVVSQIRSALRVCIEQDTFPMASLKHLILQHTSGALELDAEDARGLLRHFVASRRGLGYRICVPSAMVSVERV